MANNILTASVKITGIRPLMWHKFGPESIPLEKQERTGVAGNDPEEWKRTYLANRDGQLYLRGDYIFGCIRDGAKHTKKGRGSIQSMVSATLQIMTDRVLVDRFIPGWNGGPPADLTTDPDEPVYLDVRSVKNPATKGRNVRYRVTAGAGWRASFVIAWDKTIVSRGEMEAVIIDAGRLCGLGDGRNIGMGRFTVDSFELQA
ncbi:MAG: hypothetical protein M0R06_25350 [Sphaerochaeta sp.]|jgi:hypothetical protein|nr:hypothetical protein [Sphaerochaeta sp.]